MINIANYIFHAPAQCHSARRKNDYKIVKLFDQHSELHATCPGTVTQCHSDWGKNDYKIERLVDQHNEFSSFLESAGISKCQPAWHIVTVTRARTIIR